MVRTVATILAFVSLSAVPALVPARAHAQSKSAAGAPKVVSTAVVNVNTASAADFEGLPGVGPKLAARIVEYRQKNGPFKKIEDLMNVRGLGEKNFLKLKAQLSVGSAKPADRAQQ